MGFFEELANETDGLINEPSVKIDEKKNMSVEDVIKNAEMKNEAAVEGTADNGTGNDSSGISNGATDLVSTDNNEDIVIEPENEPAVETFGLVPAAANMQPTYIGPECIIEGNIKNTGDMTIAGTVNGGAFITGSVVLEKTGSIKNDLSVDGALTVKGNVGGTIEGSDISIADNAKIHGDIKTDNHLDINNGCVVIGNITCQSILVDGAVKGDLDIKDFVELKPHSIIKGNIKASSLNISHGAVIDGSCTLTNKDVDYAAIFGE